jgi:hypothetical protein
MPQRIASDRGTYARRELANAIGHLVFAHNKCQSQFAMIFCSVLPQGKRVMKISMSVWHSHRTDRGQREMLLAAAEAALKRKSRAFKSLSWACAKFRVLSEFRNDIVHSDWSIWVGGTSKDRNTISWEPFTTPQSRGERLKQEFRLTKSLERAITDMYRISDYLFGLWGYLLAQAALPKRPRLRFVRGRHKHSNQVLGIYL